MKFAIDLLNVVGPVILAAVNDYRASHNGEVPTHEALMAHIQANADRYLAEGAEWRATHPHSS